MRSFRLNFELNVELHDARLRQIDAPMVAPSRAAGSRLAELDARSAADPPAQQRRPAAAAVSLGWARRPLRLESLRRSGDLDPRGILLPSRRCPDRSSGRPAGRTAAGREPRARRTDRPMVGGPEGEGGASRQRSPCTRQRSSRKGTTLLAKCVGSRGPTSAKPGRRIGPTML